MCSVPSLSTAEKPGYGKSRYARMRLECGLALVIGVGLICALGNAKRAE
jgi:hypothetical protein